MALKLPVRSLPTVQIKHKLPDYLAGGKECYVEIDARPGGPVNPAFAAGMDNVLIQARTRMKQLEAITDPAESVAKDLEFSRATARDRIAVLHDACVIEWRSNILNDGLPIECTRDNFIALSEARVPEVAELFSVLLKAVLQAGKDIQKEQAATVKN